MKDGFHVVEISASVVSGKNVVPLGRDDCGNLVYLFATCGKTPSIVTHIYTRAHVIIVSSLALPYL